MNYQELRAKNYIRLRKPKATLEFCGINLANYHLSNLNVIFQLDRWILANNQEFYVVVAWDRFQNFLDSIKIHKLYESNIWRFTINDTKYIYESTSGVKYISEVGLSRSGFKKKYYGQRKKSLLHGEMMGAKAYNALLNKYITSDDKLNNEVYALYAEEIKKSKSGASVKTCKNVVNQTVYEYDVNSAYGMALLKGIPDANSIAVTSMPTKIEDDEIGWVNQKVVFSGQARVKFKVNPVPQGLKNKILFYYTLAKDKSKPQEVRNNAKCVITYAVGMLAHKAPLVRHFIVEYCNLFIKSIVLDNLASIVKYNTDAIYSLEPLNLPIGNKIGQFKLNILTGFTNKGSNYTSNQVTKWQGKQNPTPEEIKEYFK